MMDKRIAAGWAGGHGSQYSKNLWINYKLTVEGFKEYWDLQGGKCAGCVEIFAHPFIRSTDLGLKPEVDHDHKTGKVRGLLCRRCNDFLGKVKDNRDILRRLEEYLKRNGEIL